MRHQDDVEPSCIHQIAFHSDVDPSFDPENEVGPGKLWYDTAVNKLKFRTADNSQWMPLGATA